MPEQQKPSTEGKAENNPHQQVSMAVGDSEWQRDRDLDDKPGPEGRLEDPETDLPPETPVNYRQRP
jgi:hypothetical protein